MREDINNEISNVLSAISIAQDIHLQSHGRFHKVIGLQTAIANLTYSVLNYWNDMQGAGYGVIFTFKDNDKVWSRAIDIGFDDPNFLIAGDHPVPHHEWREQCQKDLR